MPQAKEDRRVFKISGSDHVSFLQNLVTNDVSGAAQGLVYSALLTPQGKYLACFFLAPAPDGMLLDVAAAQADDLIRRLSMYRLRSDVKIDEAGLFVHRGNGEVPEDAFGDPRDPSLGWRAYRAEPAEDDGTDWDAIRVAACVPEAGVELIPNETYPLEAGFERLHGVDFRKGCYVGQETVARIRTYGQVNKELRGLDSETIIPVGASLFTPDEKEVGSVTASAHSPHLDRPVALGYVHRSAMEPGTRLIARIDRTIIEAEVASLPFVERSAWPCLPDDS